MKKILLSLIIAGCADQGIDLSLPSVYVIKQADPQGKHQKTGGNREKAEK